MTKSHAMAMNTGVLTLLCLAPAAFGSPVTTGFTYQGQLKQAGLPFAGTADFQFSLWDATGSDNPPIGGTQIGATQSVDGVTVTGGLFTVQLNAGAEIRR